MTMKSNAAGRPASSRCARPRFPEPAQLIFTPSSIVGLIVFFFFSLQCFSTVAVVRKEMNSWRLAGLQLLFYTGLGYALAVITVQSLRAFGIA